jgi:predicted metal-binding membrane protein
MWAKVNEQNLLTGLLGFLIVLAWLALWAWGNSPYARFLDHGELERISFPGNPIFFLLFVAGWTLMTVAMMLPATLPLVRLFHRLTRRREDRWWLVALLIAGYLGAWTLFGIVAHFGVWILHQTLKHSRGLESNAWLIGSGLLIVAGIFQFTPLKYYCLDKCRSPLSFIMQYWRGRREKLHALWLGAHHGAYCIGCCWALMLLMFAVGVANLGWMLVLGMIMAIEKNMSWGRRMSTPLGVLLLGGGLLLALAAAPVTASIF